MAKIDISRVSLVDELEQSNFEILETEMHRLIHESFFTRNPFIKGVEQKGKRSRKNLGW